MRVSVCLHFSFEDSKNIWLVHNGLDVEFLVDEVCLGLFSFVLDGNNVIDDGCDVDVVDCANIVFNLVNVHGNLPWASILAHANELWSSFLAVEQQHVLLRWWLDLVTSLFIQLLHQLQPQRSLFRSEGGLLSGVDECREGWVTSKQEETLY